MNPTRAVAASVVSLLCFTVAACGGDGSSTPPLPYESEPALHARSLDVRFEASLDAVVFEMRMDGDAGAVAPTPAGQVDGAPVLGYVFLTDLAATDVGFDAVEGTVALAVTSHPDFDDTPLWDEDGNAAYDDDGIVYHPHWVVLVEDARAPGGLAVRQSTASSTLPPTAPMPMYLDSPGFTVIEDGDAIRVVVPADRLSRRFDVMVGGVTAYMEVDASGETPLLGVHGLIAQIDGGALSTGVSHKETAAASAWPARAESSGDAVADAFELTAAEGAYVAELDTFVLSMEVAGSAATLEPAAAGQVDGAPVLGYVFPTTIPPSSVGFLDTEGILALAVASHPDFDDTPLWDETLDGDFSNDGAQYHVHWVVLVDDAASPAGLSVPSQSDAAALPPTAPMPMYLDSPGFHAFVDGRRLSVLVSAWHLRGVEGFSYDAVTAAMRVDASGANPVLRVEEVFDVLSGDLSLPFDVSREEVQP